MVTRLLEYSDDGVALLLYIPSSIVSSGNTSLPIYQPLLLLFS